MPALGINSTLPDGYVSEYYVPIGIIGIEMPIGYISVLTRYQGGADVDVDSGSQSQPQFGQ